MSALDDWIAEQQEKSSPYRTPTRLKWETGETGFVTINGQEYAFKILDWAYSAEGDYLQTKLELSKTVTGMDGKETTQTWMHPRPVQSYKLRQKPKRQEKQGEAQAVPNSESDLWV